MKIMFKEDRELLSGKIMTAGKVYDLPKKEAEAFINNGVAKKATEKKGDK